VFCAIEAAETPAKANTINNFLITFIYLIINNLHSIDENPIWRQR